MKLVSLQIKLSFIFIFTFIDQTTTNGSKSVYSAPLSQIGSSTNLKNGKKYFLNVIIFFIFFNQHFSPETSSSCTNPKDERKTGNGIHSVSEEDMELRQNISRSRNPSSDLIIAPEPICRNEKNSTKNITIAKADINSNNNITR